MAVVPTSSPVRLFFSAKGLKDTDTFSKSDPYLVLYEVRDANNNRQLGKTETIQDDLNPTWRTAFQVDFRFECRQDFLIALYDDDGKGTAGDDGLGLVRFQLAHVVSGRGGRLEVPVVAPGTGTVVIQCELGSNDSNIARDAIVLQFGGTNLKKMDMFGLSDPYFKLSRLQPNGTSVLLYQSKPIDNTLDPVWPPCPSFKVADLCGGNADAKVLEFECWDEDTFSDDQMGHFIVSLNELIQAVGKSEPPFVLQHRTKPKTYGHVYVKQAQVVHTPTFLEFLGAGLQINVAVSIDFTGSNGDPRNPQSLHFMGTDMNQYARAIISVCDVALEYDNDKLIPAFGFGAMLPTGQVSHCFHLNAQPDPNVYGVRGVLDAYGVALTHVRLAGPTNFAPSIQMAEQAARRSPGTYTIFLILTDGAITDTDATINAIVGCGDAPMSIIIIGIGNADFSTMNVLDGDECRLTDSNGRPALRDLVQFVPFRDFAAAPREALAAEVLREVPRQVEEWARIKGLYPQHFAAPPPPSGVAQPVPGGCTAAPLPPTAAPPAPPAKSV